MTQRSLDSLARSFVTFADQECGQEPVYDALCRAAAADTETLQLLWHAPATQQRPNLLLAAVHDLILGGTPHPLREYFPSAAGTRPVDSELARTFAAFRDEHRAGLIERIAQRTTQTTEVGRCAVLWPALHFIAAQRGATRIALLDLGCSAGLNLGVDVYRYAYDGRAHGHASAPGPLIACELVGPRRLPLDRSTPHIVQRVGLDVSPVDLHDAAAVRWLRACLWPHDLERAQRFDRAVAVAREHAWPTQRHADCVAAIEPWVRGLPPDVVPVVWNSWVLTYFERAEGARCVRTLEGLVRDAGVAWLSAEAPSLGLYPCEAAPPSVEGSEYAAGTLWTLCSRSADGVRYEVVARAHPHGKWLEWLAHGSSCDTGTDRHRAV